MQIVIDIPKEFEEHFNSDRFEDSLQRIKQDIEDAICSEDVYVSGNYEVETLDMLIEAFKECTPLTKGHGDLVERACLYDFKKWLHTCPKDCDKDDEIWFTSTEVNNKIEQYSAVIEADKEDEKDE